MKPCPKCQTPIALGGASAEPDQVPAQEESIASDAVAEATPQPAATPAEPVTARSKRPVVILLALGGLAVALGGLMFLIFCCAGIAVFLLGGDRKASLAGDSKGQPYSAARDPDFGKGSSFSNYLPNDSTTNSSYSYYPAPDYTTPSSASGGVPAADEQAAVAAQAERTRREEEQRRLDAEYWAQREEEEAAEAAAREEAAERYREAFREAQRQLQAFP